MVWIFWIFFFILLLHYVLFPLGVMMASFLWGKNAEQDLNQNKNTTQNQELSVSLIIAAYNEEAVIKQKIENCLNLNYPRKHVEIIVVSDGSKDATHEIAKSFASQGIIALYQPERQGKTAALNRAMSCAKGEIAIFSDANSFFESNAVKNLLNSFSDKTVGGVSGRKSIIRKEERAASKGDSSFWAFESRLKTYESRLGSIPTGDGEIFAIRRSLYKPVPESIINDDTAITFDIVKQGYRVVYEPRAVTWEEASLSLKDDFNVKARMVCGGYQIIFAHMNFIFSHKSWFAAQFILHKILRYVMPIVLIVFFITNLFLREGIYLTALWFQCVGYGAAAIGAGLKIAGKSPGIFYFPLYYCTVNTAALLGLVFFISKQKGTTIWKRAIR